MHRQFRIVLVLGALFTPLSIRLTLSARASDADVPTIKTKSDLVVVDVVARNHKGEPVTGLPASDFRVIEDGVPQTLSIFEEHKDARISTAQLPAMPPNVFTNFPTVRAPDGVDVVLVDCLNTEPKNQVSLRENLLKYLKNASPGSRIAVFTLGSQLRLVHGFTTDFAGLAMAIADEKSGATTEFSRLFLTAFQKDTEKAVVAQMIANQTSPEGIDALLQFQAEEANRTDQARAGATAQALQQLVRFVYRIPGRKNLIWFADSFPINLAPPGGNRKRKDRVGGHDLASILSDAQVAVYPISTQGLTVDAQYDSGTFLPDSAQQQNDDRTSNQVAMEAVASATGGEAFFNTNDFSGSLKKATQDGRHYYTIGYKPRDSGAAKGFRRITIEAKNCNCKLAYKPGYYANDNADGINSAGGTRDPLIGLMQFGMPNFDQIVYKISIESAAASSAVNQVSEPVSRHVVRYSVNFAISTADVRLQRTADDVRHGDLGILLVVYSRAGEPLAVVSRRFTLTIPPKDFEQYEKIGLQAQAAIEIPTGQSYLATGVYDYSAGTIGSLTIPITFSQK